MSIDLELLTVARNYAVKLQDQIRQSNNNWTKRYNSLEEQFDTIVAERNRLIEDNRVLVTTLRDLRSNYERYKLDRE